MLLSVLFVLSSLIPIEKEHHVFHLQYVSYFFLYFILQIILFAGLHFFCRTIEGHCVDERRTTGQCLIPGWGCVGEFYCNMSLK